jgi:hypothetical protein
MNKNKEYIVELIRSYCDRNNISMVEHNDFVLYIIMNQL